MPVREIFRRFWPYARPYRRWLALGLLLIALVPLIDTAMIWMFKVVVDQVLVPQDFGPFVWIAAAYVGLTLIAGVLGFFDDFLANWIGERFLLDLRTRFFAHLQGLSLDFFDRRRLGDLISRLTGDIASIETFVLSGRDRRHLLHAPHRLLQRRALLPAVGSGADLAAGRASLLAGGKAVLAPDQGRLAREAAPQRLDQLGGRGEPCPMWPWSRPTVRRRSEVERFHRENLGSYHAEMASVRLKALYTPLIDLIELSGALLVIGLGTWELSQGHLTLGGLLVFMTFLTQLYSPVRGMSRLVNRIHAASACGGADHRDARPAAIRGRVLARGQTRPGAGEART